MDTLALAGFAVGIVGVLLALVAWLRPRSATARIAWTRVTSTSLVSDHISAVPSLQVTFREQQLRRLTTWTGKLWNTGSGPIRGEDLRELRVEVPDGELLGSWLTRISSLGNRLSIVSGQQSDVALITFDYLNSGEGAEFTILHTAPATSQPAIRGSIVGGRIKQVVATDLPEARPGIVATLFAGVAIVGGFVFVGVLMSLVDMEAEQDGLIRAVMERALRTSTTTTMVVAGFLTWLIGVVVFTYIRIERAREPVAMVEVDRSGRPISQERRGG